MPALQSSLTLFLGLAFWLVAENIALFANVHAADLQFNRDIRPILSENCFQCHGPDDKTRGAELRLDRRESAVAEREAGAAITPGKADASQLVKRILSTNEDEKMPPIESGKKLTVEQIATLQKWIELGARYEEHWSFIAPRQTTLPAVKDRGWPQNAIDHFVLARLEQEGMRPSPSATKATWLRRVTLDLTGLPPTIDELDSFQRDDSRGSHEKVVDRLLASERYGERMAMHWLDLARYADTNGYNNDEERTQWPWRDWVIDAFNQNLPYDQFIIEQLAGDLLPNPTTAQRIATAFNRNHVFTTEGGIIEEEYRVEYVADRVHTTSTVFLGLSLQCSRCHDHKFDPLSQRDYYRFFAFFNNLNERTVGYNQARVSEPTIKAPSRLQQTELERLELAAKNLELQRDERAKNVEHAQAAWEVEFAKKLAGGAAESSSDSGLKLQLELDEKSGDQVADTSDLKRIGKVYGPVKWSTGKRGGSLELDGQGYVDFGHAGEFEHHDPFSVAAWIFLTSNEASTVLSKMDDAAAYRGYDLIIENGKPAMHIVHHWPDNGLKVIAREAVSLNAWHHVVLTYDGSAKAAGLKYYVDGRELPLDVSSDKLNGKGSIKTDKPFHLGRRGQSAPFRGSLDDVRLYGMKLSPSDAEKLAAGQVVLGIAESLKISPTDRTPAQLRQLRRHYLEQIDEPYRRITMELESIAKQRAALEKAFPVTMVMQDMPHPRQAYVLNRGQYDQRGEAVTAGVPSSLSSLPEGTVANRLALARWLVDPNHPLTARVAVNRWWQQLFGNGIVETVEDFGSQGSWPTHPELLDYLATEFSGAAKSDGSIQPWNVKSLLKQIVLSATYRQSSRVTPELLERDPRNRLLSRGPRFRLPAETMRDNALAISGLLANRLGGPSVKPYQPDGLWQDVSVERRAVYKQDVGENLYRRSMYTFWKRTCPPPGMTTFDAPDRETCTIRRARTNTPLQALVLMNDPTYLEAARKLAERILREGGASDSEKIRHAYRLTLSREPRATEQQLLVTMLQPAREKFNADAKAAAKLVSVGASKRNESLDLAELAAWTTLSSVLLSLDETITKE